jgi:hypothetical protein
MPGLWIIKMTNERIFFGPKESIVYANTNLPKEHFRFKDRIQIYWLVELIRFTGDKKVNKVKVIDYGAKNVRSFDYQVEMKEIPFLQFEELNKDAFLGLCDLSEPLKLERLFSNSPKPTSTKSEAISVNETPAISNQNNIPIAREYQVEFRIKLADATIIDGAITFEQRFEGIDSNLLFEIQNPSLKAPYNTIKEYLAKRLGRKTFFVTATIKQWERKAVVVNAQSEEIALIDESFIQRIKYKQINSLLKIKQSDGRPIYCIDELLLLSDELKGNFLQTNIESIIEVLTNNVEHRNTRQLVYLAEKQDLDEVVYLTVSPYFGFVFYLRNNNRRSYIWELLDSHATYIWSFENKDRDRKQEFDIVEQSINQIRQSGRNAYKSKCRNGEIQAECRFDTIQHAINGQSADKMFDEWLAEFKFFFPH